MNRKVYRACAVAFGRHAQVVAELGKLNWAKALAAMSRQSYELAGPKGESAPWQVLISRQIAATARSRQAFVVEGSQQRSAAVSPAVLHRQQPDLLEDQSATR